MTMISERIELDEVYYSLVFAGQNGSQPYEYSFGCDVDGNVDTSNFLPERLALLALCRSGAYGTGVVSRWVTRFIDNAYGTCECGVTLALCGDSVCVCGRAYNMWGKQITIEEVDDDYDQTYTWGTAYAKGGAEYAKYAKVNRKN